MKITFYGSAKTVTGSCYLVEDGATSFLVDCGMYQGLQMEQLNQENFKFTPSKVDFLILTHAHIDHSGLLPKLVKHGFKGNIYLTPPTSGLSNLLLLDAAKIQEMHDRNEKDYSEASPFKMVAGLYNTDDALNTITKFVSVPFGHKYEINRDLHFTFIQAGHILGAASIFIEFKGKKLLFSGDLGRQGDQQSLVHSYDKFNVAGYNPDYVIMESLYAGLTHPPREQTTQELLDIINDTVAGNGNVIVPSFAVQRTQELLEIFNIAIRNKKVKSNVQFFLDSPLAIAVTKLYTSSSEYLNTDFAEKYPDITQRFQFDQVRFITHFRKSLRISNKKGSVILAGSGMADGGRVVSHLKNNLGDRNNSVIFVGFQAEGTLGRRLVDGEKKVVIQEKHVHVNAKIFYLKGFSAHADDPALKDWLHRFDLANLQKVFLVHAEPERSLEFKNELEEEKLPVEIPGLYQEFAL